MPPVPQPATLMDPNHEILAKKANRHLNKLEKTLRTSCNNSNMTTNNSNNSPPLTSFDIVIVGAGVAGTSAAHHLRTVTTTVNNDTRSILIVDEGSVAGRGRGGGGIDDGPRYSGSATMEKYGAGCIKMMVQIFAGSCDDFMRHHQDVGAMRYLKATRQGLELQKEIAKKVFVEEASRKCNNTEDDADTIQELGSYYVGYESDKVELKREFETLQRLGCTDIEWCEGGRLQSVEGLPSDVFNCAIYFPQDAVIDSSLYAKTLLQHTLMDKNDDNKTKFWPNTKLVDVQETEDHVVLTMTSKNEKDDKITTTTTTVHAKQVVMATGGFYKDPKLHGLIKPCYSYLVHVPIKNTTVVPNNYSPNFFTWGFSHDWCFTKNGKVRCSGEDHFSAYKDPHCKERCRRLSEWTIRQYENDGNQTRSDDEYGDSFYDDIPQQYGIYTETPDMVPLVGPMLAGNTTTTTTNGSSSSTSTSRVCYLLGCNAWGQAILSYCASLVPGLLGYKELSEDQKDILKLVSIQRFSEV